MPLRLQILCAALIVSLSVNALAALAYYMAHSEHTVYVQGYSEEKFRQINCQMNSGDVERLLGPPLKSYPVSDSTTNLLASRGSSVAWSYSAQATPTDDYYVRVVFFNPEGHLVSISSDFWAD